MSAPGGVGLTEGMIDLEQVRSNGACCAGNNCGVIGWLCCHRLYIILRTAHFSPGIIETIMLTLYPAGNR